LPENERAKMEPWGKENRGGTSTEMDLGCKSHPAVLMCGGGTGGGGSVRKVIGTVLRLIDRKKEKLLFGQTDNLQKTQVEGKSQNADIGT